MQHDRIKPNAEFVSPEDAAEHMGVATKTIRRWIKSGLLPGYSVGPRFIRVRLSDLDAMLTPIKITGGDA